MKKIRESVLPKTEGKKWPWEKALIRNGFPQEYLACTLKLNATSKGDI